MNIRQPANRDRVKIPLDRELVRQKIDEALSMDRELTVNGIAEGFKKANIPISRNRIHHLLNGKAQFMWQDEKRVFVELPDLVASGDLLYTPQKVGHTTPDAAPLDREWCKGLIDRLRAAGLTLADISRISKLDYQRIQRLYDNENYKKILPSEKTALESVERKQLEGMLVQEEYFDKQNRRLKKWVDLTDRGTYRKTA